jgi:hypothetical protein
VELGYRLAGASAAVTLVLVATLTASPTTTQFSASASSLAPSAAPSASAAPAAALGITPGYAAPATDPGRLTPALRTPGLNEKPDPYALWRKHLAADPAQARMLVQPWCPTAATLRSINPEERYAIALRRLYDFAPTKERFVQAISEIEDIRGVVEQVFPRSFGYTRWDPDMPQVVDIPTQVKRLVLHYTEGLRKDWGGYAHAKLIANMGIGVGYNYYINDTDTDSTIYYTSGQFAYHVKKHNGDSFGIEVAACSQAGITPRQWENLLYLVAHFMQSNNIITRDRGVTDIVNDYVMGHREIAGELGHADFPKVMVEPFRWRLIGFLVEELGYQP